MPSVRVYIMFCGHARVSLPPGEDLDYPLPPVTPDEVHDIIKGLKPRKAPGSDGITNRVLQLFPAHLIMLMATIFNGALINNIFPQEWKKATVIGIPKPGKPKTEPTSYRPISLLIHMVVGILDTEKH